MADWKRGFKNAGSLLALAGVFFALTSCTETKPRPTALVANTPTPTAAVVDPNAFKPEEFAEMSVRAQSSRIPVIMYHDIIAKRGPKSVWFDCTKAEFAAQLDWLEKQGAQPISLQQLHRHLTRGDVVPDKAVVLTFDDNYQGFYDNAYPLLQSRKYPAAMFVHTDYVGDKKSDHPKMDWDTLLKLDKEGLVTIASHTMSHPDDMRKLTPEKQEAELSGSKQALEAKLGHVVPYLAYPDGWQDANVRDIAKRVGYTMAFTVDNGPVEESPGILALNRYVHTRMRKGWLACQEAKQYAAFYEQPIAPDSPVRLEVKEYAGVPLGLIRGGIPTSRRAPVRQNVGTFVQEAGGVAGINGTFFADARLIGTGCTLIGPSQTALDTEFAPETDAYRLTRIGHRPVVIWGPKQLAIFPFEAGTMNAPDVFKTYMPDYTDMFMAGAWIVHNGAARSEDDLRSAAAGDFQETRRRAFFGITAKGEIVLGATLDVCSTTRMAEAAAEAGVQEAVLLDSGFSTSLVFDKKIIVTGHTDRNLPSRPVPHAIVVSGTLEQPTDTATLTALRDADPAVVPGGPDTPDGGNSVAMNPSPDSPTPVLHRRKRRKTHRRHHAASDSGSVGAHSDAAPSGGSDSSSAPPDTGSPNL